MVVIKRVSVKGGLTAVFPLVPKHPFQTSDLEKEPFLMGRIEQETKILTLRGQSIHLLRQ